jgi:hypothetical protein
VGVCEINERWGAVLYGRGDGKWVVPVSRV